MSAELQVLLDVINVALIELKLLLNKRTQINMTNELITTRINDFQSLENKIKEKLDNNKMNNISFDNNSHDKLTWQASFASKKLTSDINNNISKHQICCILC